MNRVYRLVWNRALCVLQVVAETAGNRGMGGSPGRGSIAAARPRLRTLVGALLVSLGAGPFAGTAWAQVPASALPTGGSISGGTGSLSTSGTVLTINQTSSRLSTDWLDFNIGSAGQVQFLQQPSASAMALASVNSGVPSQINGVLSSNGQVLLANSAGTTFGSTAFVNVGSLFSTSLGISNADFMSGTLVTLSSNGGAAGVHNAGGTIVAAPGGTVTLVGGSVANTGLIVANEGRISLVAADQVSVDLASGSMTPTVTGALASHPGTAAVTNTGALMANRGTIVLHAVAPAGSTDLVNNAGVLHAQSGTVQLIATGGGLVNTGTIDVSPLAGGPAGSVLLSTNGHAMVGGTVNAAGGRVVVDGASIALSGTLTGDRVELDSNGWITQAAGVLTAETLSVNAGSHVMLTNASNGISALGASAVGGDLAMTSTRSLSQTGALDVLGDSTIRTDGSLVLTHADNRFDGAVTASGSSVALRAAGDLTMASVSNGSNGSISLVAGGVLTLPAAAIDTGSADLQLASNGGALVVADSLRGGNVSLAGRDGMTLSGPVTASGQLSLSANPGQTILVTGNLQSSGTQISGGIVQVGNGGTSGSIAGNITNNGALVYNRSDNVVVSGAISGTGSLHKQGGSRLELVGSNTYTGATVVAAGTLALSGTGSIASSSGVQVVAPAIFDVSKVTASQAEVGAISGGGAITLGAKTLAVGAGNASSTFAGVVSGAGSLLKAGSGTLTLSGANPYDGGTQLKEGRIDLGNADALGSGTLSMDEGTTLGFAANGLNVANAVRLTGSQDPVIDTGSFDATLSGAIGGGGFLTKEGSGTLTLSGANNYTGATNVAAGTLRAGAANSFSAASVHSVASGAALDLAGYSQRIAALSNAGTVSLVGATPGTTLTVTGPWVGNGGVLRLGTALGGNGSATDKVLLSGASAMASGNTFVQVTNLGGLGAQTTGNGIEIVGTENGASIQVGAFSLAGTLSAGAYDYHLNTTSGGAYLSSTTDAVPPATPAPEPIPSEAPTAAPSAAATYRAEVSLLAAVPEQLREASLAMVGNLHQRVGDQAGSGSAAGPRQGWGRFISVDRDIAQEGTASANSSGRQTGVQVGSDLWGNPNWRAGVYVGQLEGDLDVTGFARGEQNYAVGSNDLRSQFLGGYATWRNDGGLYVDTVLQAGRLRYTADPSLASSASGKGSSVLASVEVGQSLQVAPGWTVEPQLQFASQHLNLDDLTLVGAAVQQDNESTWLARIGVRVKGEIPSGAGLLQPYARLNVYRRSSGTDTARFIGPAGSTDIVSRTGGTSTELAVGGTWQITRLVAAYGEVGRLWASGGAARTEGAVGGSLGLKVNW